MNEERKDKIGRLFLLNNRVPEEACKGLEIQELIFLIHSAKHYKGTDTFQRNAFDEKIKIFYSVTVDKIKNAEELYIAIDKNTNYPYIDSDNRIWMFSKETYALYTQDYFLQQFIQLEMWKIATTEIEKTFAELYILGVTKILMDYGQYHIELNRDEIFPAPDWSSTPKNNIPIINPQLQHAMIRFFQSLYSQSNDEEKKQHLQALESHMIDELIQAKYLVPMQLIENEPSVPDDQGMRTLKKGTTIQFASLVSEDDETWLPVFTDWIEFEKAYNKKVWGGNVATFDDILALSARMNGIVVNCKGIPLRIHDKYKALIQAYRTENSEPQQGGVTEHVLQKDTRVHLGEPREYPDKMIDAVVQFMKRQKRIHKAYLRLMLKEDERSYLIIVDFEGSKEDLFQGIAEAASPFLNGTVLDMAEMAGWVKDSVKDVRPFYKKKRFGIF